MHKAINLAKHQLITVGARILQSRQPNGHFEEKRNEIQHLTFRHVFDTVKSQNPKEFTKISHEHSIRSLSDDKNSKNQIHEFGVALAA